MKKIVMVLGANVLQIPLISKVIEMGFDALVISPDLSEPGHKISTYSEKVDVADREAVLEMAKKYKIAGVITDQTDIPVRTVAYVAEEMGLPGNSYNTACLFTDKYLMREKCKELGVKTVDYKLCSTLNDALLFFEEIDKPIILKPIDNQGSKGVSKVITKQELELKFQEAQNYSLSGKVLVEEYIEGQEFLVEGIAVDYKYENLICGDTIYFSLPDVFSASRREFPSTATEEIVKKVLDVNKKIATGFGIKQGITHGEYILNGEDVILLEIAARGGGVFISSDLINLQTGLRTEEFLVSIATSNVTEFPAISNLKRSSCYVSFFLPQGEVTEISGIKEVCELPYTHRNNFEGLCEGLVIKENKDKTSRFFVIIDAATHAELMKRIDCIKNIIDIKVKNKKGIEGIIWE